MEGLEFYKGSPSNKAAPSEFGIYSIKQRELAKTAQANVLASATTTSTSTTRQLANTKVSLVRSVAVGLRSAANLFIKKKWL